MEYGSALAASMLVAVAPMLRWQIWLVYHHGGHDGELQLALDPTLHPMHRSGHEALSFMISAFCHMV